VAARDQVKTKVSHSSKAPAVPTGWGRAPGMTSLCRDPTCQLFDTNFTESPQFANFVLEKSKRQIDLTETANCLEVVWLTDRTSIVSMICEGCNRVVSMGQYCVKCGYRNWRAFISSRLRVGGTPMKGTKRL
jgi:hypothetical protein